MKERTWNIEPEFLALFGGLAVVALLLVWWGLDSALCDTSSNVPSGNPAVDVMNGVAGKSLDTGCRMLPWR